MNSRTVMAALFCAAFAASGAFAQTLEQAYHKVSVAVAAAQKTRTRTEYTSNKIPVRVGDCSAPRYFKDPIERPRVGMKLTATHCREMVTFEEREDGTTGGRFPRPRWARVPGSERSTYEYVVEDAEFDLSYDPDSFRTRERILQDLEDACRSSRDKLSLRAVNERGQVRCR